MAGYALGENFAFMMRTAQWQFPELSNKFDVLGCTCCPLLRFRVQFV